MDICQIATKVISGEQALAAFRVYRTERIFILCDSFLTQSGAIDLLTRQIAPTNQVQVFDDVVPDPNLSGVARAMAAAVDFQPTVLVAFGGGAAIDTAKAVAHRQHKPYFTFPTVAGSCAAAASIATIYKEDGKFQDYLYSNIPPIHVFLCSRIMAQAPVEYLLRGIVDTMAKYYEASIASRGRKLQHRDGMGIALSRMCVDPLYAYGEQAVADNRRHVVSPAFEEVILSIVITSGLVSNFAAPEFNGHIAHQLFVELSDLPTSEQCRQHGGLVAYGILLLLLCDGQEEEFRRFYAFCQSIGLPTSRKATGASETEIQRVFRATEKKQDVRIMPYKVTQDMLHEAAEKLEAYHSEQE